MARLVSDAKLGYYPCPPAAIDGLCRHLRLDPDPPKDERLEFCCLDPCCGCGAAIKQLTTLLGIPEGGVYCVELHEGRARDAQALMPDAHVLGPATYFGTRIRVQSFGLVYCNPPFAEQLGSGHGREEDAFVTRSTSLLRDGGILVLVCPASVILRWQLKEYLLSYYEHLEVYPFPEDIRKYNEVIAIGRKRKDPVKHQHYDWRDRNWEYLSEATFSSFPPIGSPIPTGWDGFGVPHAARKSGLETWVVPRTIPPGVFEKADYTSEELREQIRSSPLQRLFASPAPPPPKRPPLPIGKGHASLFLVSGARGSYGVLPANPPIVVRGGSTKGSFKSKEETTVGEKSVTHKTVYSQQGVPLVRAVSTDHKIRTFTIEAHSLIPDEPVEEEGDE
jgi:hypothetical protein